MPLTLGYYTREDIPFYYALADAFTICDQHFCSCLTGTTPNRSYLWTGTIRAEQSADSPANVLNDDMRLRRGGQLDDVSRAARRPRRLVEESTRTNSASASASSDEEDAWLANFGDNPLEYFTQYNVRFAPTHRQYLRATCRDDLPARSQA